MTLLLRPEGANGWAGKRRPCRWGQMLCMGLGPGENFLFSSNELGHRRLDSFLASSSTLLHISFLPMSHYSLLPNYPLTSVPWHLAWASRHSPPFLDCHGQMASLWLDRPQPSRACPQRCSLHLLPAGLETRLGR